MAAPSRPPFLFLIPILTAIFLYYWNVTGQQQVLEAYLVTDLPGRGKGLIATRNISRGELILRDKPLFVFPASIHGSPHELIAKHLTELTDYQRAQFHGLSYLPVSSEADIPLSIFQANAVAAGAGTVGLFPNFARLNHGCAGAFNAVYSFREKEGEIVVHAVKNIAAGSELLTTYFDTKRPRASRQVHLLQAYGFSCQCSTCSLAPSLSTLSDQRLEQMSLLYQRLGLWSSNPQQLRKGAEGEEAVEIARKIWSIGSEEGYVSERGQLAADVVHICLAHSDVRAAQAWADLAIRWYGYELGRDCLQIEIVKKLIARPESASSWARRSPQTLPGTDGLRE
ncbi:hypothetical protein BDV98DRAFT_591785 [Pterulicium gracile]|uniref:SET domain-containing protein n=1 Tax=Pterulicium gracile TaxID=1884261 RepID=A0A5C3QM11_9AGAR|nr:hypothetical protein BDV98DRAFT_591785 [Pterula gracilis]